MRILVLNAGSSSLKFQLFDMDRQEAIAGGLVEKIGETLGSVAHWKIIDGEKRYLLKVDREIKDHQQGLNDIAQLLLHPKDGTLEDRSQLQAVGHRVVHGAELFSRPTVVTGEVMTALKKISFLAPLHNPLNLKGIEIAQEVFPEAVQVAVFDTAFHQTLPEHAFRFAIPKSYYEDHGLRVYGFHGTSHAFVSRAAASHLGIAQNSFNAITVHLGNGCSMAAIKGGKSVDVSMGLTPLGGLIMGTRSGDVDPSLPLFMLGHLRMSPQEIDGTLNRESGLKGLTGDNDLRNILKRYGLGDQDTVLAIEMYVYRIKKYIGAYMAALGSVHALVFTAGVGENSAVIRSMVCRDMQHLGIQVDEKKNHAISRENRVISSANSTIRVLVVPTNEELEIARQTRDVLMR